jgi:hypothetical protein
MAALRAAGAVPGGRLLAAIPADAVMVFPADV